MLNAFSEALLSGAPIDRATTGLQFKDMVRQARNAEEALLAALNACARRTQTRASFKSPAPETFGAWIRRVQGQRNGPKNVVALQCLSYLDLSGMCFDISDLYAANLAGSDLRRARLHFACLREADLTKTDLRHAILSGAVMHGAKLYGANLRGTRLSREQIRAREGRLADLTPEMLQEMGAIVEPVDNPRVRIKDLDEDETISRRQLEDGALPPQEAASEMAHAPAAKRIGTRRRRRQTGT